MRQVGLFDLAGTALELGHGTSKALQSAAQNAQQNVRFYPDFYSWLAAAGRCLLAGYPPNLVWWIEDRSQARQSKNSIKLHHSESIQDFIDNGRAACCHSSEDRWALLYSILWRLKHDEPQLMELAGDPEITLMRKYAKAVFRDVHKMKAFVRFRQVDGDSPRYVSWFEPEHFIVEYAGPFFRRRFANMQWSILTPVGCVHWEGDGELWFSDAVEKQMAPSSDKFEDAWRVYYKSIFNPARLKVQAMQSEMPKKYWKNLPEAQEIASLIGTAEARNRQMIEQRKKVDKLHCGSRPSHPEQIVKKQLQVEKLSPLNALQLQASLCSECSQGEAATQVVFGTGPENAKIMIIGEQPGDQEDLLGAPFIGPAGTLLTNALKRAGIDRDQCYLTNAVKHFGFEPQGKKRLHKRPEASVVSACGKWLQRELEIIKPDIVIYLGATAASTRFGQQVRVQRDRGQLLKRDNQRHLITVHPASILRMERGPVQQNAYVHFINDLKLCAVSMAEPECKPV